MSCLGWRECVAVYLKCLAVLLLLLASRVVYAATTQYYYDDLGRLVQADRSDGSVWQYQPMMNLTNLAAGTHTGARPYD